MRILVMAVGVAMAMMAGGCTSGNTAKTPDKFNQNLPAQSDVRSGGSVSPRSEVEGNVSVGSQAPGSLFSDTIQEPMRSVTTRPAPDASEEDAGARYDHRQSY